MTEILCLVRQISVRVGRDSWIDEKTLTMPHQIYRVTVDGSAPSLAALKEMDALQVALQEGAKVSTAPLWDGCRTIVTLRYPSNARGSGRQRRCISAHPAAEGTREVATAGLRGPA